MLSDYILLTLVFILPFLYKLSFWLYTLQLKEYRWDRFKEYLSTPQGNSALFNFWFVIELPLLLISLVVFFNSPFEYIMYNVLFYFLLIQNLFVIGKILRGRILKPKITSRLLLILLVVLAGISVDLYFLFSPDFYIYFYTYFLSLLLFTPFIIFIGVIITLPLVNYLKNKKYKIASAKTKKLDNVIKIGITGSYGKSSVKEYLSQILSKEDKTLSTPENINTELGVTAVVMNKLTTSYKYFVAELGAYKRGEIKTLGEIVNHKYGFLTAIGNQHLALFGGIKNTIKGKSEIAEKVLENDGTLYVNWDNENIRKAKFDKKLNIVKYGTRKSCDASVSEIKFENGFTEFIFSYKNKESKFKTNLYGKHNVINLAGIIAFCIDMGISKVSIKKYLKELETPKNTLKIINKKNFTLIDDSYNLSEDGLIAGLEILKGFDKKREKILVVDDILELGIKAPKIHRDIAKKIAKKKYVNKILYVGVNHKKDFVKGLADGGFNIRDIISDLSEIDKKSVILFEGRNSGKYLKKI